MPVDNGGTFFPQPNIRFQSPEGPHAVEVDDGTSSTGFVEPEESPVTVDHTDLHSQEPTGQFETPGPESVRVDGFDPSADDQPQEDAVSESGTQAAGRHQAPDEEPATSVKVVDGAQAKVVQPPAAAPAAGTSGVETK